MLTQTAGDYGSLTSTCSTFPRIPTKQQRPNKASSAKVLYRFSYDSIRIQHFAPLPALLQLPSCKWVNGQPYKVFFINNYWNVTCCVGRMGSRGTQVTPKPSSSCSCGQAPKRACNWQICCDKMQLMVAIAGRDQYGQIYPNCAGRVHAPAASSSARRLCCYYFIKSALIAPTVATALHLFASRFV